MALLNQFISLAVLEPVVMDHYMKTAGETWKRWANSRI